VAGEVDAGSWAIGAGMNRQDRLNVILERTQRTKLMKQLLAPCFPRAIYPKLITEKLITVWPLWCLVVQDEREIGEDGKEVQYGQG
jgi:hypothetical protein